MIEGSRSRAGSGSISLTSGSGRPKNTWIRIRNTERKTGWWRADLTSGDLSLRLVELPPVLTTRDCSQQAEGSQTSIYNLPVLRIRIRDPVPFWPRDPGSRTGFSGSRISDPGSRTHIFASLLTIFWVKITLILCKLVQIFFFDSSNIK